MIVAALYVHKGGAYFGLRDVDPWDEERDARRYAGPHPVVAHPPCASWSLMGNCRPEVVAAGDGGCFEAALNAVLEFGGVLEHPAHSRAWRAFGLPMPTRDGWTSSLFRPGWSCEVDQRLYGHNVRKPTWLFYNGPPPPAMLWGSVPPSRRSSRGGRKGSGVVEVANNHSKRADTPRAFRDALLELARSSALVAA
jgi:hypothetical protein